MSKREIPKRILSYPFFQVALLSKNRVPQIYSQRSKWAMFYAHLQVDQKFARLARWRCAIMIGHGVESNISDVALVS